MGGGGYVPPALPTVQTYNTVISLASLPVIGWPITIDILQIFDEDPANIPEQFEKE